MMDARAVAGALGAAFEAAAGGGAAVASTPAAGLELPARV